MGESGPLVSAIIPTFDRVAYLREAIGSVLAQTYGTWELIVADDGSRDGTGAYLASLRDPRVRVVTLEHTGNPARMRNKALALATGRYVAFLDDDDLWMPEKLARQVTDLAEKPACRWGYTYFQQIGPHGEDMPLPPGLHPEPRAGWILESLIDGTAWVAPTTVLAERALVNAVGGFDESLAFSEDYDTFIRMAGESEVSLLPVRLGARRVHPGNTHRSHPRTEVYECQVRVYRRLLDTPIPARVRRAARREYALARVRLAESHRGQSEPLAAMRILLAASPGGAGLAAWWVAFLKTCLRPFMPSAAMRLYRRLRGA